MGASINPPQGLTSSSYGGQPRAAARSSPTTMARCRVRASSRRCCRCSTRTYITGRVSVYRASHSTALIEMIVANGCFRLGFDEYERRRHCKVVMMVVMAGVMIPVTKVVLMTGLRLKQCGIFDVTSAHSHPNSSPATAGTCPSPSLHTCLQHTSANTPTHMSVHIGWRHVFIR